MTNHPGVRGRARAYRSSASTTSRLRFLSDLRSFLDLRLCLRAFLRLRSFLSREVELLDESESLLESEEERPIVDVTSRGRRCSDVSLRGGRAGGWSAGARRSPREGRRESPRRGVRTPGGRFAARARAGEKRRVERRSQIRARARAPSSRWHASSHFARIVINWRALRPGRQRPARDRPTMRRHARRGLVLALVLATFVLLPRPAEGARPLLDPAPPPVPRWAPSGRDLTMTTSPPVPPSRRSIPIQAHRPRDPPRVERASRGRGGARNRPRELVRARGGLPRRTRAEPRQGWSQQQS